MGGPSGWTGDTLLVLLRDPVCLQGFSDVLSDTCNGALDPHSASLLKGYTMAAALKKDPSKKRTLLMGEEFLKVASRYCLMLDDFAKGVFDPIQLAIKTRGGCERALASTQARREFDLEAMVLHTDVEDCYPSLDRGVALVSPHRPPHLSLSLAHLAPC